MSGRLQQGRRVNFRPPCTMLRTGRHVQAGRAHGRMRLASSRPPLSLLARGVAVAHSRGGRGGSQVWRQDDLSCWDASGPREGLGIPQDATIKWQKMAFQRLHRKSPATVIKPQKHSRLLPSRLLLCHPSTPVTSCHSAEAVCGLLLHQLSMPHLGLFSGLPPSRTGSPLPAEFPPSSLL